MNHLPFLDLPAILSAGGTVRLPGSKSLSNRILLLAALAEGETEVRDLLKSDDTDRMLEALAQLGIEVTPVGEGAIKVAGCSGQIPVKSAELFLGNAGTAFRPLTAALALAMRAARPEAIMGMTRPLARTIRPDSPQAAQRADFSSPCMCSTRCAPARVCRSSTFCVTISNSPSQASSSRASALCAGLGAFS